MGGYDVLTRKRLWKKLYDMMGGDPSSTSAATCTRRHYERLLLPFERFLNGLPDVKLSKNKSDDHAIDSPKDSKEDDVAEEEEENDDIKELKILNTATEQEKEVSSPTNEADSLFPDKQICETVENGRIINLDNDHERLILKFSRVKKSLRPNRPKLTKSNNFDPTITDSTFAFKEENKLDMQTDKNETFGLMIQNDSLLNDNDIKIKVTKLELSEQDSKFIDRIESRQTQKERLTALVHPTQRKSIPADINLEENIQDIVEKEKDEINKSIQNEKSALSSALHSIKNLVSQMSKSIPQKKFKSDDSQFSSNFGVPTNLTSDEIIPNSFVRKVFSLPKPLESPNETLISLKKKNELSYYPSSSLIPQPAHQQSLQYNQLNKNRQENINQITLSNAEISKEEILDLSVKKLSTHIDQSPMKNPEENILDLSVKTNKVIKNSEKGFNNLDEKMLQTKDLKVVNSNREAFKSNSNTSRMNELSKLNNAHSIKNEHTSFESSQQPIRSQQQSFYSHKKDLQDQSNNYNNKSNERKRKATTHLKATNNKQPNLFNDLPPSPKYDTSIASQLCQSLANNLHPSISDYNPPLPAFRSPCFWPGWPSLGSTYAAPQLSSHSNTDANVPAVHLTPAHLLFPGTLSTIPNDNILSTNPFINRTIFDQAKLLEAYTSPLIVKNLLEQNEFLNGDTHSYNTLLEYFFNSSK